ncbi:MAG: SUMF1/EgtB/PvdO family nonheme iron enzyme [Deltaproteobacteria bacterium]|nr:SUMF1/EgtB/PvdO family nonheme iron enzyme [Deltaproteobacteria bacterium]
MLAAPESARPAPLTDRPASSPIRRKGAAQPDTCIGCHTNPKYRKEDVTRLKECLACHGLPAVLDGRAGHPLKENAVGRQGRSTGWPEEMAAEAGESKLLPGPADGAKDGAGAERKAADTGNMVYIPPGEFLMGSDDRLRDEKPALVVYVEGFYMDRYEVANRDYKRFIDSTSRTPPENWTKGLWPPDKGNHPVIFVDWHDADAYCRWRGARLPREVEWEKAARGTDGRRYPWGNEWDMNKSNNPLRGHEGTEPVGSFEAGKSPYGLYDMSGNVWEWVDDEYLPHAGSDYASPEFGSKYRILKGGSWWDCMFYGCGISAPTFNRSFFDAGTKNDSFGLRCAKDAR